MYKDRIKAALSPGERKVFSRLRDARKIQEYLDTIPINFEACAETYMSPRRVMKTQRAHCFEGAVLAAAALAYHGQKPFLLDLKTVSYDEDHVVALFRVNGFWGAISKTNHAVLRYRDPVYKDVRELAMSYFHEYFWADGRKTLRSYSKPLDLSKFDPASWLIAEDELDWLVEALDVSRHFPLVPKRNSSLLRPATRFEITTMAVTEWSKPTKRPANN